MSKKLTIPQVRRLSKVLTALEYKQADKKKLNRKAFEENVYYAYIVGVNLALHQILTENKENPFETADVFLGRIQELYLEFGNHQIAKFHYNRLSTLSLEELIAFNDNQEK